MGRKILYATDISKPGFKVLEELSGLSNVGFEEIIFLSTMEKENKTENLVLFEQWKEKLNSYGLKATIKIDPGSLSNGILNTMHEDRISFAIAHFNKTPCGNSNVRDLVKAANVPILIVDKDETALKVTSKGMFERVLFATDWSPESEKTLQFLLGFRELISEFDIVNVLHEKLTVRDLRQLMNKLKETRKRCLELGIDAEYHVYAGKTIDEIMLAAQDYNSTLIVMGTTPKQSFKDIFLGKPSCRIAKMASVPTLLVP
ncbi:MAG: universal stress protein [Desulfobacterales bacterium]|nr:universal stress protein [Desulfobacterales bacterium]